MGNKPNDVRRGALQPEEEAFAVHLRRLCGDDRVLTDRVDLEPYLTDERDYFRGAAEMVLLPRTTEEVSILVRACAARGVRIVPQGGNTGLVGGAASAEGEAVLSLRRMNRIVDIDCESMTMTVEAGAILANVCKAAEARGCLFPLSLGSSGSCQIGGNIATNAGGSNVLRYGSMRELVLGLEVVLPDGRIWNGMRALYKDNTGYALRHLFVGSEGTLGVVTKAVLKLFDPPKGTTTAFCGLRSVEAAIALFSLARRKVPGLLSAFELISGFSLEETCRHSGVAPPFKEEHAWYVLLTVSGGVDDAVLRDLSEDFLGAAFEQGLVDDAIIAESLAQSQTLWALREAIPEAEKMLGQTTKHDIALPLSKIAPFLAEAESRLLATFPDLMISVFGHLGDGNLHYNVCLPEVGSMGGDWRDSVADVVYSIVGQYNGSVSAEHGIGKLKRMLLRQHKTAVELDLLERIKASIDPDGQLNPGKML